MHNSKNEKLFFSKQDFDKVKSLEAKQANKLSLLAEMVRFNSLATIVYAGSGHIGASISASEIFTLLYHYVMDFDPTNPGKTDRDTLILSKGHAAPGLYAALQSAGFIAEKGLLNFRKFGGLQGHVDISVPGIDGNTGSLGMGISKSKGYAWAHKSRNNGKSAFVIVGDGELQEGQNWEAIQSAPCMKLDNLYLIIDRNQVQTCREVKKVLDPLSIENKLQSFGWTVETVDGNNAAELVQAFEKLKSVTGKPKAIIANTLKGKGVSFMEHPNALAKSDLYKWHGGVPNKEEYKTAYEEIVSRIVDKLQTLQSNLEFPVCYYPKRPENNFKGSSLKPAFSEALVELGANKDFIVLDGDLVDDCALLDFESKYPDQFIEVGIAEQDMVSMAGGLALSGKIPLVNTYTAFLSSRSNEHIFNNCSEGKKVIYVGHMAGILPAKPGKSHQGVRDISVLMSIPNIILCHPCNAVELKQMLNFLANTADKGGYLRLEHVPPRNDVTLPEDYKLEFGKGTILTDGDKAVILSYGSLLLSEALIAKQKLQEQGINVKIVNLPWLNNVDKEWLKQVIEGFDSIICLENHLTTGGLAEEIRTKLPGKIIHVMGAKGYGQSGENDPILKHYSVDSDSIVKKIKELIRS